jgi:hypothetical protein
MKRPGSGGQVLLLPELAGSTVRFAAVNVYLRLNA